MSVSELALFLSDRARVNNPDGASNQSAEHSHRGGLNISDESMLSRLVAARLDLPASQRLLDANFKSSVIKRCWEDQLRLKRKYFFLVWLFILTRLLIFSL